MNSVMSVDNLGNRSHYETVTDIWNKWANLTTCQTFVHYQTAIEMDKETIFHLLEFTIFKNVISFSSFVVQNYHRRLRLTLVRDIKQETETVPRTQTTSQEKPHPSASRTDLTQDTTDTKGPYEGTATGNRARSAIHNATTKFKRTEGKVGLSAALNWEGAAQRHKQILPLLSLKWCFAVAFSWWGKCGLYTRLHEKTKTDGPLYLNFSFAALKKMRTLGNVCNSWVLEET